MVVTKMMEALLDGKLVVTLPRIFGLIVASSVLMLNTAVAAQEMCAPPKKGAQATGCATTAAVKSAQPPYSYSDQVRWVNIPAGTFDMGSKFGDIDEKPVHKVTLSAFQIAETEVTVAQYALCVKAKKCEIPLVDPDCNYGQPGRENFPVNCVTRAQAAAFAKWAGGRLPTEAEWEYAAGLGKGSTKGRKYVMAVEDFAAPGAPKSESYTEVEPYAWFKPNSGGRCQPVATRKPNGVGLYDMLGNVMEWVSDWIEPYKPDPATNPTGPAEGTMAQVRGGGWQSHGFQVTVTDRQYAEPATQGIYIGLRPVRPMPAKPAPARNTGKTR